MPNVVTLRLAPAAAAPTVNKVNIGPDANPSTNPLIQSDAVLYAGGPQLAITDPTLPAAFAALVQNGITAQQLAAMTPGQQSLVRLAGVPIWADNPQAAYPALAVAAAPAASSGLTTIALFGGLAALAVVIKKKFF